MNYKDELEKMFNSVYNCEGKCQCFSECSKGMENGAEINCNKLKVGKNYDNSQHIKIMFVGKEDTGKAELTEPAKISNASNPHYIGTFHTLAYLLDKISGEDFENENNINKEYLKQYDYLYSEFCLTNYFKCAFKESLESHNHDVSINKSMEKNCPKILTEEIRILKPNIIIMQGKFTTAAFWGSRIGTLKNICKHKKTLYHFKSKNQFDISVDKYEYLDTNENLYIIWGYHPCAHGRKWYTSLPKFREAIDIVKKDIMM